ncbi:MAG: hypothetical protein GWO41_12340 [candidate division Zixibacteria bacterium]|nr:hypothetical protein [candidate division Zixibacteria bacterium]NIR66056.1 hypothetical protein [candidate division Zixibacteria bacterium]NIS17140.1 hypothetical protein [candidate division Zixibacteria bacterium]NIS47686.1 hypothetical protein [candidate division Zixibacteria bacterium]NIT53495.1 hypothetical protein [candidate division Zixibacteria bacterium]
MVGRRDFIKIMGLSATAIMLAPDSLIFAEPSELPGHRQPRRILYGDKYHGCSGWSCCDDHNLPSEIL